MSTQNKPVGLPGAAMVPRGKGYFYCFPHDLLQLLDPLLRTLGATTHGLARESGLAQSNEPFSSTIGFLNGKRLYYELLGHGPQPITKRRKAKVLLSRLSPARTPQSSALALSEADKRLARIRLASSAYCGWLLTNPEFRQEHDDLLRNHANDIHQHGFHRPSIVKRDDLPAVYKSALSSARQTSEFETAAADFYRRWHLDHMAGPYLPVPFGVHIPTQKVVVTSEMEDCGKLFYWPASAPLLAGEDLRSLLQDALRFTPPPHLTGWMKVISTANYAKNKLPAYARRFRLLHFWRLLELRHPCRLPVEKLEVLFAKYLRVTPESIHRDRLLLRRHLGTTWSDTSLLKRFCTP